MNCSAFGCKSTPNTPDGILDKVIFDVLRGEGYSVIRVKRTLKGVKRTPIDVVQVDVDKSGGPSIYDLKRQL